MNSTAPPLTEPRVISGKWIVSGMFAFALLCTAVIWIYGRLHVGPFLPLKRALAAEFKGMQPQVEGGRHKDSPFTLRLVLNVDFTPTEEDERVQRMTSRLIELARANLDINQYEVLELYFVHRIPERNPERLKIERKVSEL